MAQAHSSQPYYCMWFPCSDCTTGSTCSTPVFTDVLGILDDLAANEVDSSSITSSMTSLKASLNSMPDLGGQISEIESLESSIGDVPDLSTFSGQFDSVGSTLDDAPNVGGMTSQLDALGEAISVIYSWLFVFFLAIVVLS